MISELYFPSNLLCPDVSSITVKGGKLSHENFWLKIYATEKAWNNGALKYAGIYTADISHYFNADEYEDQGYMNSITLSETIWSLSESNAFTLSKELS